MRCEIHWHYLHGRYFLEKREASLYEKMQRLPKEARDPGDSLQCGGRAGYLLFSVDTNFSLRTRMRLATLWSPASREGEAARGRGRTPGRRWGRTSSAGRARPRSTTSPLTTSPWGYFSPRPTSPPAAQRFAPGGPAPALSQTSWWPGTTQRGPGPRRTSLTSGGRSNWWRRGGECSSRSRASLSTVLKLNKEVQGTVSSEQCSDAKNQCVQLRVSTVHFYHFSLAHVKLDVVTILIMNICAFVQKAPNFLHQKVEVYPLNETFLANFNSVRG